MSCAICQKRPPKRFCPALGERICPICCGKEREVSIDCPFDCSYLLAARRYEAENRKPVPASEYPYPDVEFSPDLIYERWPVVERLAQTILVVQMQSKELNDHNVYPALEALAGTYRTLSTGIYYEKPPDSAMARAVYGNLSEAIQNARKEEPQTIGLSSALKEADIFRLLVFLMRICKQEMNGRPRSRAFVDFLRIRFPLSAVPAKEASRIVLP